MTNKEVIDVGWRKISKGQYIFGDEYYLFNNHKRNKWSIYEKESDCLNRDENFCIAFNFTVNTIDELKFIMKMADIL